MIPGKANQRMQETLKYWAVKYQEAKNSLDSPKGFATLVDCHRDGTWIEHDNEYSLTKSAFPSADKLRELGIKRVFYMNEGRKKLEKPYGVYASGDLSRVIEQYESEDVSFIQHGIWPIIDDEFQ